MAIGGEGLAHPLLRQTGHQELTGWRRWRKLPNLHIRLAPDPLPCRPVRFKASGHRLLLQSLVLAQLGVAVVVAPSLGLWPLLSLCPIPVKGPCQIVLLKYSFIHVSVLSSGPGGGLWGYST